MSLQVYSACPVCSSDAIRKVLVVKDQSVSQEIFEIWECSSCTARFTQKVPHENQISRYYKSDDYISHTDTGKGIINTLYHVIRKRTLANKKRIIEKYTGVRKKRLLDIGAGTGAFAAYMQQLGWQVIAVEPDADTRQRAILKYQLGVSDVDLLWKLEKRSIDVITMWHVLEHVHDLHGYMNQIQELLTDNGKAFIAVPNYTSLDGNYYKEFWAAYDVPRHLYHFSPASINSLLHTHKLLLTGMQPMWYDSMYISMLSEKYKNGRSNFLNALITGTRSNFNALGNREQCSSVIYIIEKDTRI